MTRSSTRCGPVSRGPARTTTPCWPGVSPSASRAMSGCSAPSSCTTSCSGSGTTVVTTSRRSWRSCPRRRAVLPLRRARQHHRRQGPQPAVVDPPCVGQERPLDAGARRPRGHRSESGPHHLHRDARHHPRRSGVRSARRRRPGPSGRGRARRQRRGAAKHGRPAGAPRLALVPCRAVVAASRGWSAARGPWRSTSRCSGRRQGKRTSSRRCSATAPASRPNSAAPPRSRENPRFGRGRSRGPDFRAPHGRRARPDGSSKGNQPREGQYRC